MADVDLAGAETTASAGARIQPVRVDVSDEPSVIGLIGQVHGGLDVLVNVAGVGSTTTAPGTPTQAHSALLRATASITDVPDPRTVILSPHLE